MAVSLDKLEPDFKRQVEDVLSHLIARGIEMRPYNAIRTPHEQAVYWRQSRAKEEIASAIERLKAGGANFLASVIADVGPQHGKHVTNALPGLSWHQWGEAVDCFWAVNAKAEWSTTKIIDGVNGYKEYALAAKNAGLNAGGLWASFKDWPHVQMRAAGSPASAGLSLAEIDGIMRERFG